MAKIHERIKNQRKDFCHKETKKIVEEYQYICVEDLAIQGMMEGSHFAKSIADASWNQFWQILTYQAAEAGRKLGLVNRAYTSQISSQWGHLELKKLGKREHKCSECGYTAHRDLNAAQNILARGLDGLGVIPRSLPPLGEGVVTSPRQLCKHCLHKNRGNPRLTFFRETRQSNLGSYDQ